MGRISRSFDMLLHCVAVSSVVLIAAQTDSDTTSGSERAEVSVSVLRADKVFDDRLPGGLVICHRDVEFAGEECFDVVQILDSYL